MWLKRTLLALITLLIPGCGREPNLKWLLDGRVEIPAAEREALRTLFAEIKASEVEIILDGGRSGGFGTHTVHVDGGHIVGLTLYRSELETFAGFGPWPRLEELRMEFSSLRSFEGIADCCPALTRLSLSHGPVESLAPLIDLSHLEELRIDHGALTDLSSAPRLPSLKAFYLTSGPLESLAGIENFSSLEVLQLFGVKPLRDFSDLPSLPHLRELRLFQNGLTALTGLPELPSLELIETSDNKILSTQLGDLPKLRDLEMHEADLLSLELGTLPSLETVDLQGEGSLFKDGGRLRRLIVASQPELQRLDLQRNHLREVSGLAPQPKLWTVDLDHNPFDGLSHFSEGFPSLRHVSIRRTRVRELPTEMLKAGLTLSHDKSEIEANMWEGVLREAFEKMQSSFVETLPAGGGGVRGHRAKCSLRAGTFSTPRLNGTGTIDRLSGLVPLYLIKVDPVSPAGGQNRFPIRATIRARQGRARVYLKYELDIRGQAEALASHRDPERPWFEPGDSRSPEDLKKGYTFAEARPGRPGSTSGEAHQLVDQLVIWVEGLDGAEGVEYVLESPYR